MSRFLLPILLILMVASPFFGQRSLAIKETAKAILKKFGKERFDLLFPDFFQDMDPVIPNDSTWTNWQVNTPEVPKDDFIYEYTKETIPKPHPDNGSNNWAISPEKSYSGNPILANEIAVFDVIVDLPTPPLPEATAMMFLIFGISFPRI